MGDVLIRLATDEDAAALAASMRMIDRMEMSVMSGRDDTEADRYDQLCDLIARSGGKAAAAFIDGEIFGLFGVVRRTAMSQEGHPWMLCSGLIETRELQVAFGRRCKRAFEETIPPVVKRLFNYVAVENEIALRWLSWMGFTVHPEIYEHNGALWRRFDMLGQYVS